MSKMINHQELSQRKIKIKPIDSSLKQHTSDNIDNHAALVQIQLEQAKNELTQIEKKKEQLLEETQQLIQTEKENWQSDRQQWIEEAKSEGYQDGYDQGKKQSIEAYQESLREINKIVDLVKVDYQATLEKTEDVIIELGMHTAEKILEQKLAEQPNQFTDIVQAALKEIKNQSVISIYLHPVNYEEVLLQKAELKRILENNTKLSLYINEELPEHSCVIEHPFGQIDAGVDTQLKKIRNALNEFVLELKANET